MMKIKHWQDPVNALLGAALMLSPWVAGYQDEARALLNASAVGALLLAVALGATFVARAWEAWTETALGVWLMASPWLLDFAAHQTAATVAVATGVVVTLLALWALLLDSAERRRPGVPVR